MESSAEELQEIKEIGPETAGSIATFFSSERNRKEVRRLLELGVRPVNAGEEPASPLQGRTLVVTGTLERFTRKEVEQTIQGLGGRVTSSVSSNTDYLLLGSNPGSKVEDARREGTAIVNEDDFLEMIGER